MEDGRFGTREGIPLNFTACTWHAVTSAAYLFTGTEFHGIGLMTRKEGGWFRGKILA